MDLYEELIQVIDRLEAAQIDYALCGGLAVAVHGYPRFTKDIDLLIKSEDLSSVQELLAEGGYNLDAGRIPFGAGTAQERVIYRISKVESGDLLSIDLVLVSPILHEVWRHRERYDWVGRSLVVVSAEGLAHMKRLAGRLQDQVDLQQLGFEEGTDDKSDQG